MLKLLGCSRLTGLRLTSAMALPFCRQAPPSARNPRVQHDEVCHRARVARSDFHPHPSLRDTLSWICLSHRSQYTSTLPLALFARSFSTLTEFRTCCFATVCSICSLSELASLRSYANPLSPRGRGKIFLPSFLPSLLTYLLT